MHFGVSLDFTSVFEKYLSQSPLCTFHEYIIDTESAINTMAASNGENFSVWLGQGSSTFFMTSAPMNSEVGKGNLL